MSAPGRSLTDTHTPPPIRKLVQPGRSLFPEDELVYDPHILGLFSALQTEPGAGLSLPSSVLPLSSPVCRWPDSLSGERRRISAV